MEVPATRSCRRGGERSRLKSPLGDFNPYWAPWKAGVQNATHFVNLLSVQVPVRGLSTIGVCTAESASRVGHQYAQELVKRSQERELTYNISQHWFILVEVV